MSWALLELAVMPLLIFEAPLGRQANFTMAMQILAQDTKEGLVPRDHLLLLGDSYAKGLGDWLLTADFSGHPPFHSAHVLHEELGADVLSFGEGGASSIDALVRRPRQYTAALARFGLGAPQRIVAYFYEGNDLQDNERYLRRAIEHGADGDRLGDAGYLDAFLERELARDLVWWRRWATTLFTPQYVSNSLDSIAEYMQAAVVGTAPKQESFPPGHVNRARIGGVEVELPDGLDGPALEMTADEWSRALVVLDRSLASLRKFYPDVPILVVYVPSPISCYEVTSPTVSVASSWGRSEVHPTPFLRERRSEMRRRVSGIVDRHSLEFLDLTPGLRVLGAQGPIHGPRDWAHFNEEGYRAVGRAVAAELLDTGLHENSHEGC